MDLNSILIKFPFSSVNDENYELYLYASRSTGYADAIAAMNADSRCFKFLSTQTVSMGGLGNNYITSYEGSLVGDVIAEDDTRDDVFEPLVSSKLKFNIQCQTFPVWLMDICDYFTNVKVMLVVRYGAMRIERWRGYLMANTLNMTVVDDLMACPLVAIDEVGISKYMRINGTFAKAIYSKSPTLYQFFKAWWKKNCASDHPSNSKFDDLSTLIGVNMNRSLLMARDMRYTDGAGNEVYNILGLTINLEKYFLDREATWSDVFADICNYLGVSFYVGSYNNGGNDCYMLSDTDYSFEENCAWSFNNDAFSRDQSRMFGDFGNQQKVGADLQIDYKPCEWKGVKVKSTPERPPIHSYLDDDNVKAIAPSAGHDEWCETRIGKYKDNTTIDDYKYRVFQYANIVDKEDQFISESEYVKMEFCQISDEGVYLGSAGYFPYNDGGMGHYRPQPDDVDSMDFALSKRGVVAAKIGTYETPRQKVSADLKNYFVILNNMWGRLYWDDDTVVSSGESRQNLIATFFPFANDESKRPNNTSYLQIDFSAIYLNENIGSDCRVLENGGQTDDLHGKIQSVFPITESFHDWAGDPDDKYTGNLTATSHNYIVDMLFQPVFKCKLSIGDFYWNGTNWEYITGGAEPPMFNLRLTPVGATDKYWMVATGYMHGNCNNYYYEECRPRVGASDNIFRVPLSGLSIHGQPLEGKVKLELYWPVPFVNGYKYTGSSVIHYNNVLFVLLSDIKMEFVDDALLNNKDIDTVSKTEIDPSSKTKKIKDVELNLSTPSVDGIFNNCLLFDNGKSWVNLQAVHQSTSNNDVTPEEIKSKEMATVLCDKQVFVEFSRPFAGVVTDNIYNVGFTVRNLTETSGIFMPLTRKFNWTKGTVRWKLQKVDGGV